MAKKYQCIAEVTVGSGGASSISFTSIPGTYTDLLIRLSARTASNYGYTFSQTDATLNSTGYSQDRVLYGYNGALGTNTGGVGQTYGTTTNNATSSTFGNAELYVANYTSSRNKVMSADGVAESNSALAMISINATRFNVTSAITSISLSASAYSGNFVEGSTAYLYGISNS